MRAARVSGSRPSASRSRTFPTPRWWTPFCARGGARASPAMEGRRPARCGCGLGLRRRPRPLRASALRRGSVRPAGARRGSLPRSWPRGDWRGDAANVRRVATPRFLVSRRARLVRARSLAGSGLGDRRFGRPAEGGLLVSEARVCPGGAAGHRRGAQRPLASCAERHVRADRDRAPRRAVPSGSPPRRPVHRRH